MTIRNDTANIEKAYLLDMLPSHGRILEIGCGDGRLTWNYAHLAASITGIDLTPDALTKALRQRPERLTETVSILQATALSLPFKSSSFDQALFSLSL